MSVKGLVLLWAALRRILDGKPLIVSVNDFLSYDLVCLEAGFKRGYLKANRKQHDEIRARIAEEMAKQNAKPKKFTKTAARESNQKKIEEIKALKAKYEMVLAREVLLIDYISRLEKKLEIRNKPRLAHSNPNPV
ncbi:MULTISPECIES: hypothetical protein [Pseudomonas]|uniref:Uncharacterized protein n=1 Tax=Pseudomonas juntendi TaxID=2666183 RepID=A0A7W2LP32_9PSED|nr:MULTISPECIES: hypothetical protein [Pseudomonas]MBA6144381.1 hypothetical protein [Pseudomonas juntendi]